MLDEERNDELNDDEMLGPVVNNPAPVQAPVRSPYDLSDEAYYGREFIDGARFYAVVTIGIDFGLRGLDRSFSPASNPEFLREQYIDALATSLEEASQCQKSRWEFRNQAASFIDRNQGHVTVYGLDSHDIFDRKGHFNEDMKCWANPNGTILSVDELKEKIATHARSLNYLPEQIAYRIPLSERRRIKTLPVPEQIEFALRYLKVVRKERKP